MRLIHASIPADDPRQAAEILADIMHGEALPFPPGGPDACMAWSRDGMVSFEIVPRGHLIHYGADEGEWRAVAEPQRLSEVHLAVAVDRPASEVAEIARRADWPTRICSRGEGLFELVEVWVEGAFMLEMFDPSQAAHYERTVTVDNLKKYLATAA